jgi:hypothetical protein
MKFLSLRTCGLTAVVLTTCGLGGLASAQEATQTPPKVVSPSEEAWHRTAPQADKLTLAREKAVQRGEQRMARLEALRWYGYSNSRPIATTMPFTTMYSPAWQQPGGRPYAWYTTSRPIVIITGSPMYR